MEQTEDFKKEFEEHLKKQQSKFDKNYVNSISDLKDLFTKYSIKDILDSLFATSLWLKNISAQVRIQLAYMVFTSLDKNSFKQDDKIAGYNDFKQFCSKLIKILPDFPMLEDYVPEPDWGEIKYYHNKKIYKMFYGNNFDGIYEYLEAFQILHCTFDDTYLSVTGRSPIHELENVLSLQESIIDDIGKNYDTSVAMDIEPGYLEVPEGWFWENCTTYQQSNRANNFAPALKDNFTLTIGDTKPEELDVNNFLNDFHEDKNFRFMFIESEGILYPILPRRYLSMLIEVWGDIFQNNKNEVLKQEPIYELKLNQKLCSYIENRIPMKDVYEIVSPFDKAINKPSDSIYSCSIQVKNDLYLIYLLKPSYGEKEIETNLNDFVNKLNDDVKILEQEPRTLLLRKDSQVVAFVPKHERAIKLNTRFLILIPRISYSVGFFPIPEELYKKVFLLEDFLGIIDEINGIEEMKDFLEFMYDEKNGRGPLNTALDMFGAFRESHGLLIPGATEPTMVILDSGWGSNFRYKNLKEFWSKFPANNLFSHPRSYEIDDVGRGLIRLVSRNVKMSILHARVDKTNIFINAPFTEMGLDDVRISDLLMQILQDGFLTYNDNLTKFKLFQNHTLMHIFIFPYRITNNDSLKHLEHLDPEEDYFKMDWDFAIKDIPAIRIGYNYDKVFIALKESNDRSFELEFFRSTIEFASSINADDSSGVIKLIESDTTKLPRFTINLFDKLAAFPEHEKVILPEQGDFKASKKLIAQLALKNDIKPGKYSVDSAKIKLNKLKSSLVDHINNNVNQLDFEKSIGYLISKTDALNQQYELKKITYEKSIRHEVDYAREEKYAENHTEYIKSHRNFRYLIEKLVQLSPKGSDLLNETNLKELLAIIDWLHVIQIASDMIHYSIAPTGINVEDDFRVDVEYKEDVESMEDSFGRTEALLDLELIGKPKDRVDSTRDITVYLDKMERAFRKDLGFGLRNLVNCMEVLKLWPSHYKADKESVYYQANFDELFETTNNALLDVKIPKGEYKKILDFLTLVPEELLKIIGQNEPTEDLPIWEHNKRPARYNLKPLIKISETYIWGPYSVRKAQEIWMGNTSSAMFPYEIQSKHIRSLLEEERRNISEGLNIRAEEIIKRYTPYVKKNCEAHKLNESFPDNLGDYDVLSYLESKNIILNIECKDLEPPFCLKDAKRLRERLFGRTTSDRGYFEKVIRREDFLKNKYNEVLNALKWPLDSSKPIKVISIFLMRRNYWWTKFPPFDTDMVFLRIDMLDEFLSELIK
ncbi:MAG TPA: hypothetical protein PKE39_02740 [Ignavibacteria bacterium]|nr:hypothetical protein [Ignavibacteria bacterium]